MAHKTKHRLQHNKRANESFQKRHKGMSRSEWAEFKKTNPQEAHQIKLKNDQK